MPSRCELRRVQDDANGLKSAFLIRSIEIQNRRKWTGIYYFYRDQDCMDPTYGLKMHGKFNFKNKNLTFSISSLSFAIYNSGFAKEIMSKYNKSCPGDLTITESGNPIVYSTERKDISNNECLKALGVGKREFGGGASFETLEPPGRARSDELLQTVVDLTKYKNSTIYRYQWPLVRHNKRRCLTCAKIALARFRFPPLLYVRNSTSLDGVWASVRCQKSNRGFWTTRIDKFDGNKFDLGFYQMDHTQQTSRHRCQSPLLEVHSVGTARRIGNSLKVPGGVVYQLYTEHAYLTPRHRLYEQVFNAADKDTCGKDVWEVGKTQDVMSTRGCASIGYEVPAKGIAIQLLIRSVNDENSKEMFLGIGLDTKSGPLSYFYMTQSCNTYPVEVTTTPGPTDITTIPTEATTTPEEELGAVEDDDEVRIVIENIRADPSPTSDAVSLDGVVRTILVCLFVYLQPIWLA